MDFDNGWSWAMMVGMILIGALLVGLIVWAIVSATRASHGVPMHGAPVSPGAVPPGPTARDVLDQRYARGEIETADYEERRSKLG